MGLPGSLQMVKTTRAKRGLPGLHMEYPITALPLVIWNLCFVAQLHTLSKNTEWGMGYGVTDESAIIHLVVLYRTDTSCLGDVIFRMRNSVIYFLCC